jgi:hypothetical protein
MEREPANLGGSPVVAADDDAAVADDDDAAVADDDSEVADDDVSVALVVDIVDTLDALAMRQWGF